MAILGVDALVLRAADLTKTVAFYRAVGLPLDKEQHEEGPLHYTCKLGGLHFAVYPGESGRAPDFEKGGSAMFGLRTDGLDALVTWLRDQGALVLREPEDVPWGRRAIVADPDGRRVELNEVPA